MNQVKKSDGLVRLRMPSDYGIAIAQSGTQIKYADDYQRIVDTRWRPQGTAVAYPIDVILDPAAGLFKLFDHNLGFVPAIEGPRQTDRLNPSPQSSPIGIVQFCADDSSVYIVKYDTSKFKIKIKGYIYVYDFPINEPFDSEYKGVSMASTGKSDRGVKINGNSEWSLNRLEDDGNFGFAMNTNNKQINVAKVDSITFKPVIGGQSLSITHTIPYPPLIKFCQKLNNKSFQIGFSGGQPVYQQFAKETWTALSLADANAYVNAGTQYKIDLYVSGTANQGSVTVGYVIFRDPSEIAG